MTTNTGKTDTSLSFGMDKRLMTIKEFSEIVRVAPKTLYRLASSGKIPCIRIGRNIRFSHDMIAAMRKG